MAAALVVVPSAGALTINVTTANDTYGSSAAGCSLREAITAAQTDAAFDGCPAGSGADVVSLPNGQYTITRAGAEENSNTTGDFDIVGTGALSIQSANDSARVVVNGNGLDRVFDQQGNSSLSIRSLQVKGGVITQIEDGGGLRNNVGTMTVEGVTVSGNSSAFSGGGIAVYGTLNMVNSTLSGNSADGSGGGLYVTGGSSATARSSTISANVADADTLAGGDGGGFRNSASTVTLVNTIVAGNDDRSTLPGDKAPECESDPNFFPRYVLTTQAMGPAPCLVGFNPGTSKIVADARIGPLEDNGGQTPTHALLAGSPAIDAGGTVDPDQCPASDQAGRNRPPGSCDIGAVQFFRPPAVSLKINKIRPNVLRLKRGKKAKSASVVVSTAGSPGALNARLCLKPGKTVKKALRFKGKLCRKLGTLAGVKTVKFRIAASRKAKGKTFKVKAVLSATGATSRTRLITVKVR